MAATAILHSEDFYQRLGLARSATRFEVLRAYRRLIRLYPPDRAPEAYRQVREAYETLLDDDARAAYNAEQTPLVRAWIDRGMTAMRDQQYAAAERHYEQVLIYAPALHHIRNLYGLCLLYQTKWSDAAAEYERLLQAAPPIAPWHGNAGRAYMEVGELEQAERAFTAAAGLAAEEAGEYHTSLADVHVARKEFARAKNVLVRALASKEELELQDVRVLIKLLEIHILQRDPEATHKLLTRILDTLDEGEQSRYAAWKLAALARSLVLEHEFAYAVALASAAVQLDADPAHSALTRISTYLRGQDFEGALAFLDQDPSFAVGGWLAELRAPMIAFCTTQPSSDESPLQPPAPPPDSMILGFGTRFIGERLVDEGEQSYVSTLYLVAFLIPLLPLASYRILRGTENRRHVLVDVPFGAREWLHLAGFALLAALLVGAAILLIWR